VQSHPAELVDVVAVDAGAQQAAQDPRVIPLGGPEEARAVEAVLVVDARSVAQGELEQARVVVNLAGGDQVGALDGFVAVWPVVWPSLRPTSSAGV
jgi:hypothetical protein